jgi:hypothetical protein
MAPVTLFALSLAKLRTEPEFFQECCWSAANEETASEILRSG